MSDAQFSVNQEAVKALIGYVIPAALAFLVSIVGPLADFAWSEVIRTWRGLVVLGSLVGGFFVSPKYCVWMALGVFVLFIVKRLTVYWVGPKLRKQDFIPLYFSGFYETDAYGRFKRTGNSSITDAKFIKTLDHLLLDHRIQEEIPMRIVLFRPPRIIHSRCNYEGFEKLMRRYAASTIAVMWGVIDDRGRIRNFEVTSFDHHYLGGEKAIELTGNIGRVCQLHDVHTDAVVDYLASAYAAMWGHSFCELLNLQGKWQSSYLIASNSRRLFEKALGQLRVSAGTAGDTIIDFQEKQVLPLFVTQEAINLLKGNQFEDAVIRLVHALKINPLWPCYDAQEFADFYTHRYAFEVATRHEEHIATQESKGLLVDAAVRSSQRAWLDIPPNLQYLKQWLYEAPDGVKDLEKKIENWFTELRTSHPTNCFIHLYWADAIKAPHYVRTRGKKEPGMLPLKILNKAIEKCEEAYDLCPTFPVIATRLSGLYLSSLISFNQTEPEFARRLRKAEHYLKAGRMFYTETLPETVNDSQTGKHKRRAQTTGAVGGK